MSSGACSLLQCSSVLALALAALSQCTTNSVYLDGRVTECHRADGANFCKYGVCWGDHLDGHR